MTNLLSSFPKSKSINESPTGVADSPRALTSALPQITPSAPHDAICLACSGLDTPKPTHTYRL